MLKPVKNKIQFRRFHGTSKSTCRDFDCFEFVAGDYTCLIFPKSKLERKYLDQFVTEAAHEEFQEDGESLFD